VIPVTGPVVHGEGPHWDSETGVLFFVDIESKLVNKYDPATNRVTHAQFGESANTFVMLARQVLHCTLFHYALSTLDIVGFEGRMITVSEVGSLVSEGARPFSGLRILIVALPVRIQSSDLPDKYIFSQIVQSLLQTYDLG
jgi:hypothetical protein